MISRAVFGFNDPIVIDVPSELTSTTICLRLRGIHSEQTNIYPISGFPRKFLVEDTINGTLLFFFTMLQWLSPEPELRLDKRAELIKERDYGVHAVANDLSVAVPGNENRTVVPPTNNTQHTGVGEEVVLARAESAKSATATNTSTTQRRDGEASSRSRASQLMDTSNVARQGVSIADLRTEANYINQTDHGRPGMIANGDELSEEMCATLSLGESGVGFNMMAPDFGSDDSDGPPTEGDDDQDTE